MDRAAASSNAVRQCRYGSPGVASNFTSSLVLADIAEIAEVDVEENEENRLKRGYPYREIRQVAPRYDLSTGIGAQYSYAPH